MKSKYFLTVYLLRKQSQASQVMIICLNTHTTMRTPSHIPQKNSHNILYDFNLNKIDWDEFSGLTTSLGTETKYTY